MGIAEKMRIDCTDICLGIVERAIICLLELPPLSWFAWLDDDYEPTCISSSGGLLKPEPRCSSEPPKRKRVNSFDSDDSGIASYYKPFS